MSRLKCPLCQNQVEQLQVERFLRERFPGAEITPGGGPTELDGHMMFQHGFTRAHGDNTSEGVAESYYRVVGELFEIDGRTFKFGDFVEFKNGRLKVHVPGGVYPDNEGIQVTRIVKTTVPVPSKARRKAFGSMAITSSGPTFSAFERYPKAARGGF